MTVDANEPIYFYSRTGPYSELSNFAPYGLEADGVYWPTVEHYFQAQKFSGPQLAEYRERIRRAQSPKLAKQLGRTRSVPLRADWESVKEQIMLDALRRKFTRPDLAELLTSTKNRPLIEAAPDDYYWGCGREGTGQNRLGELLMVVRSELLGNGRTNG